MLLRIVKKEVLSNLITLRFSIGIALFLVLIVLFTSVLIGDYRQKLENYNKLVSKNNAELRQLMTYQNLKPTVYKPPEILTVFSKGIIENMRAYLKDCIVKDFNLGTVEYEGLVATLSHIERLSSQHNLILLGLVAIVAGVIGAVIGAWIG